MDPPERVACELIALFNRRRNSAVVGWPEKIFVRVNAVLPGSWTAPCAATIHHPRICPGPL